MSSTASSRTKENKAAARAWTEKIQAIGGTNIFDGLEMAFLFAGRDSFDKNYSTGADTELMKRIAEQNGGQYVHIK